MANPTHDADREVSLIDDADITVLPDYGVDDGRDWSDLKPDREARLFDDRPPHWDI